MARPATAAVRLLTGEREPVRLATTANITLYGLQTIDAVAAEVGDRVLVKNQADQTQNGIYTASEGQWSRAADARTARTLQKGTTVHVQSGSINAGKTFVFNTDSPVVGDTAISIGFYISDSAVTDAQTAAMAAAGSASAASTSATNAAASASAASTSATNAANSATVASGSATSAAASATNAGNSATAAAGSANAASTAATNAGNSATAAAGSAAAAAASASSINLPAPAANTLLVRNAGNTAYDPKPFVDVRDLLDVAPYVADRTALAALTVSKDTVAVLKEAGREGAFIFSSSNLSALVTADPQQGLYVAPASDTTGASGAWVRQLDDLGVLAKWFGASSSASAAANVTAIQAAINMAKTRQGSMKLDVGTYSINALLDISACSNVSILGEGTGTVISTTSATAQIFYASGVTAIAGFSLSNLRLTASVTRTGTTPFIQVDPFIRKSYFQNVQADNWNSFMWLKQFETVNIEGVFADQMTTPPNTTFGIQLGTQSASNTGAAVYIDKCQFRGGTIGSSVEANWSMGLLLNDVEGISVSNSDFQKFDTNFVGDASTRLANLFFSNTYFDTTWIGPCFMMRGNGIKVEIQFKNGWVASAGQASGSPVTTSGAYGVYLKGAGSYGRIQFDTEYYNCAQNAIVITATSCDARFSGRVYSNATTTADNAVFCNTGLASAAPSLENLNVSGGNSAACISYGANSTNYYISGVKADQLVNLLGTPLYVDIVGATNARAIASAATLALPHVGGTYAITSTGTTFTSLPATWIDRVVTLIFQSARTIVTGGTLFIAGGTFTTANQSTLTLRYDGSNWYEVSRKA